MIRFSNDEIMGGEGRRTLSVAESTRRRWRRAGWFGVAALTASSPLSTIRDALPAGSTERGVVLMLVPLLGIAFLPATASAARRPRFDLIAVSLALLVSAESVSVWRALGARQELHVLTGSSLLVLGLAARTPTTGMSVRDLRRAVGGLVAPLSTFLAVCWAAQYLNLVPPAYDSAMRILAIHGARLQGLTSHPNSLGWISAVAMIIAVASEPSFFVWVGRVIAAATIVATDSRTSIVVAGIGVLMIWVLGPERRLSQRATSAGVLAVAGIFVWNLINIQRSASADVLTNRDVIWHKLLPYLHSVPWFGYGPEFLQSMRVQLFGPYVSSSYYVDAQNQWLSDALQYGIPVAIITSLLFIALATRGPLLSRRVILLPLMAMVFVECFSEVPISLWSSSEAAFPLFLILVLTPLGRIGTVDIETAYSNEPRENAYKGRRLVSGWALFTNEDWR